MTTIKVTKVQTNDVYEFFPQHIAGVGYMSNLKCTVLILSAGGAFPVEESVETIKAQLENIK